jgi:hypothetical protein
MGIRPARPEGFLPELTVMVFWNGVVCIHTICLGDGAKIRSGVWGTDQKRQDPVDLTKVV